MKPMTMILPAVMALAACGSDPDYKAENASVAEVSEATQDAVKLQPGQWETRATILGIEGEGVPPQMQDAIKQQGTQTAQTCLTPEMAARPPQDMLGAAKSCTYQSFEMSGGNMKATLVCGENPAMPGMAVRATMSGTFSSTAYDITSDSSVTMPGGAAGNQMTTRTQVTGKRIGECDAATKAG